MLRNAKRPLAGYITWRGEAEVIQGRYTTSDYDRFVYRAGQRIDLGNAPVVTVNLNGGRSGSRTFNDPAEMRKLANELLEAAAWLAEQQIQQQEGGA